MTTPYWSDFVPNSTFYRILSGFHRTFATDVACRKGTLTPPDTWSRPFGTFICSTCWDQSFSELVVTLPDYALRISLGTFSILLIRGASPGVSDELWDKNAIGGRRWNVATKERKICNMEIEIVTFVVKGSAKLTVPTDWQEQIQVGSRSVQCWLL